MHPLFPHQLSISWNVTVLEVSADGIVSPACQKCHAALDIHQPDEASPDHLMGTCRDCGCWHMIEMAPSGREAYLLEIPGVDFVRKTLADSWTGGGESRDATGARGLVSAGGDVRRG
jgi:hypothetical protein